MTHARTRGGPHCNSQQSWHGRGNLQSSRRQACCGAAHRTVRVDDVFAPCCARGGSCKCDPFLRCLDARNALRQTAASYCFVVRTSTAAHHVSFLCHHAQLSSYTRANSYFSDPRKKRLGIYTIDSIHTCASALKQFFRELDEPLLTFDGYAGFVAATKVCMCACARIFICKNVLMMKGLHPPTPLFTLIYRRAARPITTHTHTHMSDHHHHHHHIHHRSFVYVEHGRVISDERRCEATWEATRWELLHTQSAHATSAVDCCSPGAFPVSVTFLARILLFVFAACACSCLNFFARALCSCVPPIIRLKDCTCLITYTACCLHAINTSALVEPSSLHALPGMDCHHGVVTHYVSLADQDVTRMKFSNLAAVFAPTMMACPDGDEAGLRDVMAQMVCMDTLLKLSDEDWDEAQVRLLSAPSSLCAVFVSVHSLSSCVSFHFSLWYARLDLTAGIA